MIISQCRESKKTLNTGYQIIGLNIRENEKEIYKSEDN